MSSQNDGIPFYNEPDSSGFRLIEVPAEIVAHLESQERPVYASRSPIKRIGEHMLTPCQRRLYLEPGADDMATLKSPDKRYSLKQKNTSNGLFLIKPHAPDASSPQQGIAAIATIKETVELEEIREVTISNPAPKTQGRGKWHERFGRDR